MTCQPDLSPGTRQHTGRLGVAVPGQARQSWKSARSPRLERRREEGGERRAGEKDIKKKVRAQGWLILEGADSLSNLSFQWFEMNCSSH